MSVADTTIFICLLSILNYLLVYRLNKFIGSIFFLLIAGILLYLGSTYAIYGFMMLGIALVLMFYNFMEAFKNS